MPTYVYYCDTCRGECEVWRPISQYDVPPDHPHPLVRVISPAVGIPDIQPYVARAGDMAGKPITSRREHREFLKRNRLVEMGDKPPERSEPFRKVTKRGEVVEDLKRAIAEHTVPDFRRGGLRERRGA